MKNPIYKKDYSHENSEYYKIDLPYTDYNKHIKVLCKVSEGYEKARQLALIEILKNFMEVTEKETIYEESE